jgi:hypothetical protein
VYRFQATTIATTNTRAATRSIAGAVSRRSMRASSETGCRRIPDVTTGESYGV